MSRTSRNQVVLLCFTALLIIGCGQSGPKKYHVTGEVTWEGAPLPEGDIILEPTDGGIPDHGKIVAGKFEMQATEGSKKVSILATREAAEVDPSMGMAPRVNYIPLRYQGPQTTLTASVEPSDENHLTFALTEKGQ